MNPSHALTLRPARTRDAVMMASMSRELIEHGLRWRYTPRRLATMIVDPDMMALVAEDGALLGGFAMMQFGDELGHLTLLAVQAGKQRKGIATAMLEWLLGSARVAGLASISLELRIDNHPATSFYLRHGFVETAIVPDYYGRGIGAKRMTLQLRETRPL